MISATKLRATAVTYGSAAIVLGAMGFMLITWFIAVTEDKIRKRTSSLFASSAMRRFTKGI